MPNFKPHPAYLCEMKRYGILPIDLPTYVRIDPYQTGKRYWQSLCYGPPARTEDPTKDG